MAVTIKAVPEHKLIVARFTRALSREDMSTLEETIDHLPPEQADFDLLAILADALEFHLTAEQLREFGRRDPQLSPESKRVIVASDQLAYGFSRMYASVANRITDRFSIYPDLDSACEYLGVPVEDCDLGD